MMSFFSNDYTRIRKKELIGIAKEAELKGISLEEQIGMQGKDFCDNLLQEGEVKRSWTRELRWSSAQCRQL
ncbi:MAG: hypothetical protein ACLROL_05570 [Sellimonas sp.]|uniref:hypothetical protein n=1 Tax=Sellimonas sp. TaxID=2021466 RepID=UPI0039A30EB3